MTTPRHRDLSLAADLVEGRLEGPAARAAEARLLADPAFAQDVDFVRSLQESGRDLPLVAPPPVLRQRLRQTHEEWWRARAAAGPGLLEVLAHLVFDSRVHRLGLAARGAEPDPAPVGPGGPGAATVHLLWSCEVADVVVDARPTSEPTRVDLRGQVLLAHHTDAPVFTARASGPEGEQASVEADEHGRFALRAPRTTNTLSLSNGRLAVRVELDLDLGRHP